MAVSMDTLNLPKSPVPPSARLAMPAQNLAVAPPAKFRRNSVSTWLARLITFGGGLALTVYAAHQMFLIVSLAGVTSLQWLIVGLFTITFGWIALAATGAIAGVLFGGGRALADSTQPITTRTVLLMPVYNEDPAHTFSALQAMGNSLVAEGLGKHFEIFVISDTTDPDVWVKETAAIQQLRDFFGNDLAIWYRRRHNNQGKKAGNVHEFVTRWGGRYDFMIVLDADSLLATDTLTTLVREMQVDKHCGILQTLPHLYGGKTLFARLQQFAGTVYGPIVARGITAWQGNDGNYWGHNAIIRVKAFADAAGLPTLPGRKPFGGEILSHDFVEAALIRRAGWDVRMLPSLRGSWEESPPTLADVAVRDRRWAQGNLQHLAVINTKGFRWPNRVHMAIGVMSYLASPLWLALITVGLAVTAHAVTANFEYFTDEHALFPRWPVFDSARMIDLFVLTMVVLLLPKIFGVIRGIFNKNLRQKIGVVDLIVGAIVETLFSVFYAPIFMLIQSKQIFDILRGRDSGWAPQQRNHRGTPWAQIIKQHSWHMLTGMAITAALLYVSIPLLLWMTPTLVGLLFAIPLSALSGSVLLAKFLKFVGLLRIPEEVTLPSIMAAREKFAVVLSQHITSLDIKHLVINERLGQRHLGLVHEPPATTRGKPDVHKLSAILKIKDAMHIDEALHWLSPQEKLSLLTHSDVFEHLLNLKKPLPVDSHTATGHSKTATASAI